MGKSGRQKPRKHRTYQGRAVKMSTALSLLAAASQEVIIDKAGDVILPHIYAALAIALHEVYGWGHKRIDRAFTRSQQIWQGYADRGEEQSMIDLCYQLTGIQVVRKDKGGGEDAEGIS